MSMHVDATIGFGVNLGQARPPSLDDFEDMEEETSIQFWDLIKANLDLEDEVEKYKNLEHQVYMEVAQKHRHSDGDTDYSTIRSEIEEWKENTDEGQKYQETVGLVDSFFDSLKVVNYGDHPYHLSAAVLWKPADTVSAGHRGLLFDETDLNVNGGLDEINEAFDRFWEALDWQPPTDELGWILMPTYY